MTSWVTTSLRTLSVPIENGMHVQRSHLLVLFLEPSESFAAVLKAYQNLEPGDFTGFLKLLKSPASRRLQTRCTTFLDTMETNHVTTSAFYQSSSKTPIILH